VTGNEIPRKDGVESFAACPPKHRSFDHAESEGAEVGEQNVGVLGGEFFGRRETGRDSDRGETCSISETCNEIPRKDGVESFAAGPLKRRSFDHAGSERAEVGEQNVEVFGGEFCGWVRPVETAIERKRAQFR
jgi:hypothetical protein